MTIFAAQRIRPEAQEPEPQNPADLGARLLETRRRTLDLALPLGIEDQAAQANEDASPTKWHLAHVTWFFEAFVLSPYVRDYRVFDAAFNYCFNSYYEAQGPRQPRGRRGLLSRPTYLEVRAYRAYVDEALDALIAEGLAEDPDVARLIEIGINHEEQHQELILTDILSLFAANPLRPAYRDGAQLQAGLEPKTPSWVGFEGGVYEIGHHGRSFAFDHELPRHEVLLRPFKLADRLIANAEWLDFIADGGYRDPALWLADGWTAVNREGWTAPLYWEQRDGQWLQMTLFGLQPVDRGAPVLHVSYFEADAFARWAGKRLPSEFEWEVAAAPLPVRGNMLFENALRPLAAPKGEGLRQMFGDAWEWTQSGFSPYPGYRPSADALGEYNGKFMCSQQVLRGASCVTPNLHARATYRNFFYPHQRWQFCGLRLADEG